MRRSRRGEPGWHPGGWHRRRRAVSASRAQGHPAESGATPPEPEGEAEPTTEGGPGPSLRGTGRVAETSGEPG